MKTIGINGLFFIGGMLLLYVFSVGRIWNSHSMQMYLLLSVGIMNISLGLFALALTDKE